MEEDGTLKIESGKCHLTETKLISLIGFPKYQSYWNPEKIFMQQIIIKGKTITIIINSKIIIKLIHLIMVSKKAKVKMRRSLNKILIKVIRTK